MGSKVKKTANKEVMAHVYSNARYPIMRNILNNQTDFIRTNWMELSYYCPRSENLGISWEEFLSSVDPCVKILWHKIHKMENGMPMPTITPILTPKIGLSQVESDWACTFTWSFSDHYLAIDLKIDGDIMYCFGDGSCLKSNDDLVFGTLFNDLPPFFSIITVASVIEL